MSTQQRAHIAYCSQYYREPGRLFGTRALPALLLLHQSVEQIADIYYKFLLALTAGTMVGGDFGCETPTAGVPKQPRASMHALAGMGACRYSAS